MPTDDITHNNHESGTVRCPSCGFTIEKNFCSQCGEQKLTRELRSVKHLIHNFIEDITSFDGKILSTIRLILTRPGQYEKNFCSGKRIDFLRPITFFLIVNVLFVILSPLTDFYVTLIDQVTLQPYSPYLKPWLDNWLQVNAIDYAQFEQQYNQLVVVLARSIIIIQVPIYTIFVSLICFQRQRVFADYLVFSLNFHSWLLIWVILAQIPSIMIGWLVQMVFPILTLWEIYLFLLPVGVIVYLTIATRVFFEFRWWTMPLRIVLLLFAYRLAHQLFRLSQFFITFAMVDIA